MIMTRNKTPELSLAVQYGLADADLPRWRIRRWVWGALLAANAKRSKPIDRIQGLAVTIRLANRTEARELNRSYRGKDHATNVLTFDYAPPHESATQFMADIVICTPVLRQEAKAQGKPYLHHAAHLVVHGTLHALGYDHQHSKQALEMETLETEILQRWGIENPYAN
jgi:probable rRNA maturation factor